MMWRAYVACGCISVLGLWFPPRIDSQDAKPAQAPGVEEAKAREVKPQEPSPAEPGAAEARAEESRTPKAEPVEPAARAADPPPQAETRGDTSKDGNNNALLRVLVERNIFSRDRSRRQRPQAREAAPRPRPVEESWRLTGIVKRGDKPLAFLENSKDGTTARKAAGEEVASGKIISITFDAIEYQNSRGAVRVAIGSSLTGERVEAPAPAAASSSPSSPGAAPASGAAAGAAPTGGSEESILERLRRKRLEETKN